MRLTLLVMIAALISGVAYAQGFAPNSTEGDKSSKKMIG